MRSTGAGMSPVDWGRAVRRLSLAPASAAVIGALLVSSLATPAAAQGVRISGASTARYVQLRPLVADSVPVSQAVDSTGLDRFLADGTLARCLDDGFCRFLRAASVTSVMALMQDVDATAWGFGRGMSARAELRFREAMGDGRNLWPQGRQHMDVLALYADMERDRVHARLGRQWYSSELGFRNFDGAFVEASPLPGVNGLKVEGYAGWSLLQGLVRGLTSDALAAVEDLPPDARGMLVGGSIRWRPGNRRGAFRAQYEREIRSDRGGLYAERAAAAGDVRLGGTNLGGEVIYDFATGEFNEARLNLTRGITRGLELVAEGRHSTPFFPLWTIWGAFSPVGFDEARLDARLSLAGARVTLTGRGAYRQYRETNAGVAALAMRTDGWRLGGSAAARLGQSWVLLGNYGIDVGTVASRSDGDVALRWRHGDRLSVAARGTAFETISEWRIGTGRVVGGGADVSFALRPDLNLVADAMLYRQRENGRAAEGPWNQKRAMIRLEWNVGGDPGATSREAKR